MVTSLVLHRLGVVLLAVLLLAPLARATHSLHGSAYAPIGDAAMIEQRVRDVGTRYTPLIGVPGRMGDPRRPAHHPGPLGYYALAIPYRVFGSSAWALQAATALLNGLAVLGLIAVARRTVSPLATWVVGLSAALLIQGYGLSLLTEPWNPYFSALWFTLFLLTAWRAACGDLKLLPVVGAVGSFCAQAHVAYVAVCGSLSLAVSAAALVHLTQRWHDREARQRALRALACTALCVAILWTPPLIEAFQADGGNLSALVGYFVHSPEPPLGFRAAVPLVLKRLDAWHLVVHQSLDPGGLNRFLETPVPQPEVGALVGAAWLVCATLAIWLRSQTLLVLHALVAASLIVAVLAASRIVGGAYHYLLLWGWSMGVLLLASIGWTACQLVARLARSRPRAPGMRVGKALLATGVACVALRTAATANEAQPGSPHVIDRLASVTGPTIQALTRAAGPSTGIEGTYLVTSSDPFYGTALEVGLANELERAGLRAGVGHHLSEIVGAHRTYASDSVTARVQVAGGVWVERWRRTPGAIEVAYYDPRSDAELEEFARLRDAVVEEIKRAGLRGAVKRFDETLTTPSPLPPLFGLAVGRLAEIGGPVAVFIVPPGCDARARCRPPQ